MLKSIEFLSGKSRGRVGGSTKSASPTPVILGLVLRILFQQGSNLVNKFALLLYKCWLREDSRNKSENDGCRGRMFSAFCTFFKYPSPDTFVLPSLSRGEGWLRPWCDKILGTRPRMTGGRGAGFVRLLRRYTPRNDAESNGEGMHRPWCDKILGTRPRMTGGRGAGFVRLLRCYTPRNDLSIDTPHSALPRHSLPQGAREQGRSMIEMLGVLAIIGVLSVGGIAGYSKAMEKFKINKLIEEYNMAIFGALEHIEDFRKLTEPNGGEANSVGLKQMFVDLGLVPHTWKIGNLGPRNLIDSSNNVVGVASRNQKLLFDIYIGGVSTNDENKTISPAYSAKLCKEIFQNITKPLHSVIYVSALYKTTGGYELYYGDSFCGNNKKCLNDVTVEDINKICNSCTPKDACGVSMQF